MRCETMALSCLLRAVLDVRLRPVAAIGGFGEPLALGGLVLDRLGAAGHALLGGGAAGGGEGGGMGRERFRKYAVDGVGPATVVLDDFVGHVAHRGTWLPRGEAGVNAPAILCQNRSRCRILQGPI